MSNIFFKLANTTFLGVIVGLLTSYFSGVVMAYEAYAQGLNQFILYSSATSLLCGILALWFRVHFDAKTQAKASNMKDRQQANEQSFLYDVDSVGLDLLAHNRALKWAFILTVMAMLLCFGFAIYFEMRNDSLEQQKQREATARFESVLLQIENNIIQQPQKKQKKLIQALNKFATNQSQSMKELQQQIDKMSLQIEKLKSNLNLSGAKEQEKE
jgi:hypothetical protein